MLTTLLLSSLGANPALACGGFFCNQSQPVLQAAERIVFGLDHAAGAVEMHVQITYEGDSDDFAWIVPVPSNPELFLSTEQLFQAVNFTTAPVFTLNRVDEGNCITDEANRASPPSVAFDASSSASPEDGGGVVVLQETQVGPYETIVLQGDSAVEVIDFLQEHGYDLDDDLDTVLQPYVSGNSAFVALRLAKDKDAGDVAPLGLRYPGDRPTVPIQLTSVAATPDMRLEVYVFSDQRVVPESYLHVKINEALVNWWNFGQNYPQVITWAADEAGGHAFATDYFGTSELFRNTLAWPGRFDLTSLATHTSVTDFVYALQGQFSPTQELLDVLEAHLPVPDDVAIADFVNCPDCYSGEYDDSAIDAAAATADLDEFIVGPLENAEALFAAHPYMSRMTSSLDAVEMTVDPVFAVNPDMTGELVSNQHTADLVWECGNKRERTEALRRLELSDGRVIMLPSQAWFDEQGVHPFDWLRGKLEQVAALIIEETSSSGQPVVLFDYTDEMRLLEEAHNDEVRSMDKGCGCATSTAPGSAAGLALLLGLVVRRRR